MLSLPPSSSYYRAPARKVRGNREKRREERGRDTVCSLLTGVFSVFGGVPNGGHSSYRRCAPKETTVHAHRWELQPTNTLCKDHVIHDT